MRNYEVVIVGGGIAGVAIAWQLALNGGARVLVLEREPLLASHASGRNAAIFRQLDHDRIGVQLAVRSGELLAELESDGRLIRRTGSLLVGEQQALDPLSAIARELGVAVQAVDANALYQSVPALAGGEVRFGLWVAADGVLDTHALIESLVRLARGAGATFRTDAEVVAITADADHITGVQLADGSRIAAHSVVLAAGAWAGALARGCGCDLPLQSYRRHLALLEVDGAVAPGGPVVWRLDDELYFRAESGGVLASPCDEEVWEAGVPPSSADAWVSLAERLPRLAPGLSDARLRRGWACLRTFSSDRLFVAGEDPRRRGLFHLVGLGGRGMSCGLALGELVAGLIHGKDHPLAAELSPARGLGAFDS